MKLPDDFRKPLVSTRVTLLVGAIGYFGGQLLHSISAPFWQSIAPVVPSTTLLPLCALSLFLVFLLAAWVVYLHIYDSPRYIRRRYRFDTSLGMSAHKRDGTYFCPRCLLATPPLESQLSDISGQGRWFCHAPDCKQSYYDERAKQALREQHQKAQRYGAAS